MLTEDFNVVVLGGLTAGWPRGCLRMPNCRVLPSRPNRPTTGHVSENLMQAVLALAAHTRLYKTPVDWDQKTVPQMKPILSSSPMMRASQCPERNIEKANLDGRKLCLSQGKMLGRSSGMNGLLFNYSAKVFVNGWAKLGTSGWEWSAFL